MRKILPSLLILFMSATAHANTRDGLVGWWKFDELSGDAIDSSGQGNTGTPTGTTIVSNCQRSGCRNFNGTSDYVNMGAGSSLANLSSLTLSAWLYPVVNGGFFLFKQGSPSKGWRSGIGVASLGLNFRVDYDVTDLLIVTNANTLIVNVWQHVVITWDGSTTATNVHMYKNGVEITGFTIQQNGANNRENDSANSLVIGSNFPALSAFINGSIDDVRVYSRVLTAQEISDLYDVGVSLKNASLNNFKSNF